LSRGERLALVEREAAELPLSIQAELLSLSRASLYYQPVLPSADEVALKHRIDEIYTDSPFYGSRRIAAQLRREGKNVNRKAVQRHMREMGIAGICPGPNLSKRGEAHRIYPYLLRHVTAAYPNHVWGIDITYIRLQCSWLYLVAVLDWFSRYVVSWQLDDSLEIDFVLLAVEQALTQTKPLIWNSDQGSHFTSPQYTQRLGWSRRRCKSVWMAKAAPSTMFSPNGCGARSNMRRSICMSISPPGKPTRASPATLTCTTIAALIKPWLIARQRRSISASNLSFRKPHNCFFKERRNETLFSALSLS
jgi:putative transposase